MRIDIIYQDKDLTLTRDFLTLKGSDQEAIRIERISEVVITRERTGDYKAGAVLFFVIGILTIAIGIGLPFFVLAIAAWNTNVYKYDLQLKVNGKTLTILSSKRKSTLKSLANTINGLALVNKSDKTITLH